jgi:putative ABC transport system permease protein
MSWTSLLWRNLSRNKLRSLLTGLSIALAIALVCFLATMPDGLDRLLDSAAGDTRIVVHSEAGAVYPLPRAYLQKIRAIPGVLGATSWIWFGGAYREEDGVTFPSFAIDPADVGTVWADWKIDPAALAEFAARRDAAIVGRGTMQRYGWKPGDRVTLASKGWEMTLSFTIAGEIPFERVPQLWFQREYLDQAIAARGWHHDLVDMIWLRVSDPHQVDAVMSQIDDAFRNSEYPTASETEKGYVKNLFAVLEGLAALILIVSGLLAICIVFIAANTASMAVRERAREIAILRALGFSRRRIFALLLAEATLLATLAGALGAGASLGLSSLGRAATGGWSGGFGPLSWFIVTHTILIQGLFLSFFIGLISGVVPALSAARRGVAETLREVF